MHLHSSLITLSFLSNLKSTTLKSTHIGFLFLPAAALARAPAAWAPAPAQEQALVPEQALAWAALALARAWAALARG